MVEQNQKMVGVFIMAFIALVLGAAFLTQIANEQVRITQQNTATNEQVTLVNASAVALAHNQLDAVTSVVNATNATDTLALGVGYTVDLDQGKITSLGRGGGFNVTYTWREVKDPNARSLVGLIVLFFALAVFLVVLAYLSPAFREWLYDQFRR